MMLLVQEVETLSFARLRVACFVCCVFDRNLTMRTNTTATTTAETTTAGATATTDRQR